MNGRTFWTAAVVAGLWMTGSSGLAAPWVLQAGDGNSDSAVTSIGAVDRTHAVAFGLQKQPGSDNAAPVKLITSDGSRWSIQPAQGHKPDAILFVGDMICFPSGRCYAMANSVSQAAGIDIRTNLIPSIDGGKTWTWPPATQLMGRTVSRIVPVSDRELWLCDGATVVLHTTDGGAKMGWKVPTLADGTRFMNIVEMSFPTATIGYALNANAKTDDKGVETIAPEGALLKTSDGGETWTLLFQGQTEAYDRLWMTSEQDGWMMGHTLQGFFLRRTRDGGLHWEDVPVPAPTFQVNGQPAPALKWLNALWMFDAQSGWLIASAPYGQDQSVHTIFRIQGGALQEVPDLPTQNVGALITLACADPGACWAGGQGLVVIGWVDDTVVPPADGTGGADEAAGEDGASTGDGTTPEASERDAVSAEDATPAVDGYQPKDLSAYWDTSSSGGKSGCHAGTLPAGVAWILGILGLAWGLLRRTRHAGS
ncbi:MAG TPA: hypothetical protein PLQ97_12765 [Myxococcota bacterium]|nr:hypothetical protein [Myxococcota bacterium]HQK52061.1 hypothetical protein [Myxococcota bacterium]